MTRRTCSDEAAAAREDFANWMRELRGLGPRGWFGPLYGLGERAIQDLEQGRVLPSRATVVLMHAIATDPVFMRKVARGARDDLATLDRLRTNRNKLERNRKTAEGETACNSSPVLTSNIEGNSAGGEVSPQSAE